MTVNGTPEVPDVLAEAGRRGIPVFYRGWPESVVGAIGKDIKGYFILVNSRLAAVSQRFMVAYGLTQVGLDRDGAIDAHGVKVDWQYQTRLSPTRNRIAIRQVYTWLMPQTLVLGLARAECLNLACDTELDDLAGLLQVTPIALRCRLGIPT